MLRIVLEEVEVTGLAQNGLTLRVRETLEIIFSTLQKSGKGLLVLLWDGHIASDVAQLKTPMIPPVLNGVVGDGPLSKRRLIEINAAGHTAFFEEGLIVVVVKSLNEDTKIPQQLTRHR